MPQVGKKNQAISGAQWSGLEESPKKLINKERDDSEEVILDGGGLYILHEHAERRECP